VKFIDAIVREVAELPDRDSPPDQPEMMLVTADELRNILLRHGFYPLGDNHHNAEACPHCNPQGWRLHSENSNAD
jgi:hypothetical protein